MLFDYIGWTEVADLITKAIVANFIADCFTADLAGEKGVQAASTSQFSKALIDYIKES
jgi:isocitrate dehydrogenase